MSLSLVTMKKEIPLIKTPPLIVGLFGKSVYFGEYFVSISFYYNQQTEQNNLISKKFTTVAIIPHNVLCSIEIVTRDEGIFADLHFFCTNS